jgi:hypothetical protein
MERFLSIPENGREFRISSIVLQRGGFYVAREAILFELAMDRKSDLAWRKVRWEHVHEHTLSCEDGKCYRRGDL